MVKRMVQLLILSCLCLLIFSGCVTVPSPAEQCTIVLEDNGTLYFQRQVWSIDRHDNATVTIGVPSGMRISQVNYDDYSVSAKTGSSQSFDYYTLTLHQVRYSVLIRIETAPAYTTDYYIANGSDTISVLEESPHLYFNTLPYQQSFSRDGYLPIGWNTRQDGSGIHVGFGSRIDHRDQSHMDLYLQYLPCSPVSDFSWTEHQGEVTITGYSGSGDLVIPAQIASFPVTGIAAGAFDDLNVDIIALPPTLRQVEPGAFSAVTAQHLYFFDSIESICDASFSEYAISHIHIQAAQPPVYSGSYFDTLSDKMDYLDSLKDRQKIVLFCGSSARFGYDSPMLESAFPDYRVVNLGVYAYTNMRPLADMILPLMGAGDVLLSSPELDAIEFQFCGETALDKETFCMVESNYDLFARLDAENYSHIFDAFQAFNQSRVGLTARSYSDSASSYDEDGVSQLSPTYNQQGDYILYRPDNSDGKLFGIKRACYNRSYIRQEDIEGLNRVYDRFSDKGVQVLFTYSPRSAPSITEDSTDAAIAELDEFLRQQLHAEFISPIGDSLMDPYYFFGTDNHLSTEGVAFHTQRIIGYLQDALTDSD